MARSPQIVMVVISFLFFSAYAAPVEPGPCDGEQCYASVVEDGSEHLSLLQREVSLLRQRSTTDDEQLSLIQETADLGDSIASFLTSGTLQSSNAEEILKTLEGMAEKDVKGLLKADPELVKMLDKIIVSMESTIIKGIETNHKEDVKEIARMVKLIVDCKDEMETLFTKTGGINALKTVVTTAKSDLTSCRTEQATKNDTQVTKCTAFKSFVTGLANSKPSCVCSIGSTPDQAVLDCLEQAASWGGSSSTTYTSMDTECDQATTSLTSEAKSCDATQKVFEADFCGYGQLLTTTCDAYDTCYDKSGKAYEKTKTDVKVSEHARKAEYKIAKLIICFVKVLKKPKNEKPAALKACQTTVISTDLLDIDYTATPGKAVCDTTPVAIKPCDGQFIQTHYTSLGSSVKAPAATCTPCAWSGGGGASKPGDALDLVASTYSGSGNWKDATNNYEGTIVSGITWDSAEMAFRTGGNNLLGNMKIMGMDISPSKYPSLTMTVEVKLNSYANNRGWLVTQDNGGYDRSIIVHDNRYGSKNGVGFPAAACGTTFKFVDEPLPLNKWVTLTGVWNQGGDSYLFVDTKKSKVKKSTHNSGGRANLWIGGYPGYHNHRVDGWFRSLKVWGKALTDTEVAAMLAPAPAPSAAHYTIAGPLSFYKNFKNKYVSPSSILQCPLKSVDFEATVKQDGSGHRWILSYGPAWNRGFSMGIDSGLLRCSIMGDSVHAGFAGHAGHTKQFKMTWDGNTLRCFIDGKQVGGDKATSVNAIPCKGDVWLGGEQGNDWQGNPGRWWWTGRMSNIKSNVFPTGQGRLDGKDSMYLTR